MYTISSLTVSMAQLVSGLVIMRWVDPEDMGIWTSVKLLIVYSSFLLLGINNGLSRELPYHLGKGEAKKADHLASSSLLITCTACLVLFLSGAVYLSFFSQNNSVRFNVALLAVIPVAGLTLFTNYLIVTFRSKDSFINLAKVQSIKAAIMILLIPLVVGWKFYGLVTRGFLVVLIVTILMHHYRPMRVSMKFDLASLKLLFATGFPIFILDYMKNAALTSDRLVLINISDMKTVGYWALASMVFNSFSVIPSSISHYVYPKLSYTYGQSSDPERLWKISMKNVTASMVLMIPMAAAGWFIIPQLVENFFPQYSPGIEASRIMLLAAILSSVTIAGGTLWSMKAWRFMVIYQVVFALHLVIGPLLGAYLFLDPLQGVAVGILASYASFSLIGMGLVYIATHRQKKTA